MCFISFPSVDLFIFSFQSLWFRIGICFRSPVATHLFIFLAGPRASENKMLSCRSSGFILAGIYTRWTVCVCVSVYIYTASSPSQGLMCAVISEKKGTKEKLEEDEVEYKTAGGSRKKYGKIWRRKEGNKSKSSTLTVWPWHGWHQSFFALAGCGGYNIQMRIDSRIQQGNSPQREKNDYFPIGFLLYYTIDMYYKY